MSYFQGGLNYNGNYGPMYGSAEGGGIYDSKTGTVSYYSSTAGGGTLGWNPSKQIGVGASGTWYPKASMEQISGDGKAISVNVLFFSIGVAQSFYDNGSGKEAWHTTGFTFGVGASLPVVADPLNPFSYLKAVVSGVSKGAASLLPSVTVTDTHTVVSDSGQPLPPSGIISPTPFILCSTIPALSDAQASYDYMGNILAKGIPFATDLSSIDPNAFITGASSTPIYGNSGIIGSTIFDRDGNVIRKEYTSIPSVAPFVEMPDGSQVRETDFGFSVWHPAPDNSAGTIVYYGDDQNPLNGFLDTFNGSDSVRTLYKNGVGIASATLRSDGSVSYDTHLLDGSYTHITPQLNGFTVSLFNGAGARSVFYGSDGTIVVTTGSQEVGQTVVTNFPDGSVSQTKYGSDGSIYVSSLDAATGYETTSTGKFVKLPDGSVTSVFSEQVVYDADGQIVSQIKWHVEGSFATLQFYYLKSADGSTTVINYDGSGNIINKSTASIDASGKVNSSFLDYTSGEITTTSIDRSIVAAMSPAVIMSVSHITASGDVGPALLTSTSDSFGMILDQTNYSILGVPTKNLHLDPVTMARTTTTFDGLGQVLYSFVSNSDGSSLSTTYTSGHPTEATLSRVDGSKVTYHYTNGVIDHQVDYAADGTVLHDTTFPQMGGSVGSPGGIPGTQVPSGNIGMPTVTYDPATGLTTTVTDGPSPDGKGTLHTVTVSKAFGNGTSQTVSVVATDGTGKVIHSETYYDTGKLQHTHSLNAFDGSTSDTDFDALGAITHGVTTAADGSRQVFDYSGGTVVEIRAYDAQGNLVSDVHPGQPSTGTGSTGSTGTGGGSTTYNPGSGMPTGSGGSSGSPTFSSSYDPTTGLTTTTSDMADPNGTGTLHTVTVLKQAAAGSQGGLMMQTVSVLTTDAFGHVVHSEAYSDAGLLQHVHNVDTRTHFVTDTTYDGSGHILHTENTSPDGSRQVSDYTGGLMTSGQTYNAAGALTSTYADGHYTYTDAFYANSGGMPTGGSTGGGTGGTSTMPSGGGSGSTGTTMPPSGSYDPNAITTRDTSDPSTGDSTHLVFKGGMPSEMVRTYADGAHYDFHVGIVPAGSGMTRLDVTDLFSHDDLSMLFGHEATRLDALDGTKDGVIHVGGDLQVAASAPDLFGAIEHQVQAQLATQPAGMDAATLQSMHDAMTAGYVGQATDMLHHVVMNGFSTLPDLHA